MSGVSPYLFYQMLFTVLDIYACLLGAVHTTTLEIIVRQFYGLCVIWNSASPCARHWAVAKSVIAKRLTIFFIAMI